MQAVGAFPRDHRAARAAGVEDEPLQRRAVDAHLDEWFVTRDLEGERMGGGRRSEGGVRIRLRDLGVERGYGEERNREEHALDWPGINPDFNPARTSAPPGTTTASASALPSWVVHSSAVVPGRRRREKPPSRLIIAGAPAATAAKIARDALRAARCVAKKNTASVMRAANI